MFASKLRNIGFALLMTAGFGSTASAQLDDHCSPFYGCDNDLQWFEPVDLDLDCRGCCQQCGFFFSYDKTYWATTGERIEIGDPNTVQTMFRLYTAVPLNPITGQPINPPLLTNSIRNAIPRANFHLGDRYDFGYWAEDGDGWLLSVLNGPDDQQSFTLGTNGGAQEGQGELALPLGDVFVAFRTDPGLLAGFLDIDDGILNGILTDDDDGDGTLDGDGLADDLNDNGQHGADGVDAVAPGNEPDSVIIGLPPDFGDLVIHVTAFRLATIRNSTKLNGFELMRAHRLDNGHFKVKNQNNYFEWHYGARFLQFDDNFVFNGLSGLTLGDTLVDQQIVNNIIGPQVGYKWTHARGRWTLDSTGKFMWGMNIREWDQTGFVAEDSTPGRINHGLYLRPKSFSYGRSDNGFSPVAELRVNLNYRMTDNIKVRMGYTGTFVDNLRRAATHIDWALYENGNVMGFRDVDESEESLVHGLNLGIEITQ